MSTRGVSKQECCQGPPGKGDPRGHVGNTQERGNQGVHVEGKCGQELASDGFGSPEGTDGR